MSIEEKRRASFEAAIVNEFPTYEHQKLFDRHPNGKYWNPHIRALFVCWNAALDSVVIELPRKDAMTACSNTSTEFDLGYEACAEHCLAAIKAAGLKVTP